MTPPKDKPKPTGTESKGKGDKDEPKTHDQIVAEAIKKSGGKRVRSV